MRTELGYGEYIIKEGFCDYWIINNFLRSGGKLYLTNKRIIFEAYKAQIIVKNFEIYHKEIVKLDFNGLIFGVTVNTIDNRKMKFRVFNREEWVEKIAQEVESETGIDNIYNLKELNKKKKLGIIVTISIIAIILGFGFVQSELDNSQKNNEIVKDQNLSINNQSDINLGWNKDRIYEGLREFQKPISEFETDGLKFRIDMMTENTFRLAIWNTGYSLESQPIEVIDYSTLEMNEDGTSTMAFLGSWQYGIKLDKDFKPVTVELGDGENTPEIYQVTKITYFSSPFENINTSNSQNSADNSNFSDEEIISVLDSGGLVANELKVIKKKNGKALVFINESYSNPSLSIVDMLNRTVEYTQYGSLSNEVDTTISDMNKDIYWVIKTKVFNKETYIDNIGLINMNLLTGETVFVSEYPATMEADWLSYPKEDYKDLSIDINKAIEINSISKSDENGDGFEDFRINGRNFNGGGYLTFYSNSKGFSTNN